MDSRVMFFGIIFMLLACLVFLAGCNGPELPADPEEAFDALSAKGRDSGPKKLSYDYTLNLGAQGGLGLGSIGADVTVYYLSAEKYKAVASVSLLGMSTTTAIYRMDGKTIECTENPLTAGLTCSLQDEAASQMPGINTEVKSLDELFSDYEISFAEDRTFDNRKSKCFNLKYSLSDMKDQSQFGTLGVSANMSFDQEMCLDLEKGFLSYMDIATITFSEITQEETPGIGIKMELDSYSEDVSESDFELPVSFSLGASVFGGVECTADEITLEVMPYKDLSGEQATVNIGSKELGETAMTIEQTSTIVLPAMTLFEGNKVTLEPLEGLDGTKTVEVCVGDECYDSTCYVSSFTIDEKSVSDNLEEQIAACAGAAFQIDMTDIKPTYYEGLDQVRAIVRNTGNRDLNSFLGIGQYSDGTTDININYVDLCPGCSGAVWTAGGKEAKPTKVIVSSRDCTGVMAELLDAQIETA